jgi:hypothetical protein
VVQESSHSWGSQLIFVLNNEPILVRLLFMLESGERLTVGLVLNFSLLFGKVFFAFGFRSGTPAGLMGVSFCP